MENQLYNTVDILNSTELCPCVDMGQRKCQLSSPITPHLRFETGSLSAPEAQQFSYNSWPVSLRAPCLFPAPRTWVTACVLGIKFRAHYSSTSPTESSPEPWTWTSAQFLASVYYMPGKYLPSEQHQGYSFQIGSKGLWPEGPLAMAAPQYRQCFHSVQSLASWS